MFSQCLGGFSPTVKEDVVQVGPFIICCKLLTHAPLYLIVWLTLSINTFVLVQVLVFFLSCSSCLTYSAVRACAPRSLLPSAFTEYLQSWEESHFLTVNQPGTHFSKISMLFSLALVEALKQAGKRISENLFLFVASFNQILLGTFNECIDEPVCL